MKKSLLALAVLGAYAGVASAQSSVQLFGTLDVNARYIKNDGRDRQLSKGTDGINSSEIRFQGIEDLGGGLKAGFNLRSGINPDTGTRPTRSSGIVARRSACTPTPANCASVATTCRRSGPRRIFDAVRLQRHRQHAATSRATAQVRADNSIGYFLPSNLGGFYGQLMFCCLRERHQRRPAGPLHRWPVRLPRGSVRHRGRLRETELGVGDRCHPGQRACPHSRRTRRSRPPTSAARSTSASRRSWASTTRRRLHVAQGRVASRSAASFPFGQSEVRVGYDVSKMDENSWASDSKLDQHQGAPTSTTCRSGLPLYGTVALLNNKDNTIVSLPGRTSRVRRRTRAATRRASRSGIRHFF